MRARRRSAGWASLPAGTTATSTESSRPPTAPLQKYADKDMVNPAAVIRSGVLMFEFMGWPEVGGLIERALAATIAQRRVTYDLERLMTMDGIPNVQKLGTSAFASAIIENMDKVKARAA